MAKTTTKFKLEQANQLQGELSNLLTEKISFSVKWDVKNILNSFKEQVKNYQEQRIEIFKIHGEETPAGSGNYQLLPENIDAANKELTPLNAKQFEVIGKLPLGELETITSETPYFLIFDLVAKK